MPVLYRGIPRVDRVVMSYYERKGVAEKLDDLVVINLSFADEGLVEALEEGGGSGPPSKPH